MIASAQRRLLHVWRTITFTLVVLFVGAEQPSSAQDGLMVDRFDPAMAAARERAHATLPHFLSVLRDRTAARYAVKVPVSHVEGRDHIWIDNVRLEGDRFVGSIEDTPRAVTGLKQGAALSVLQSEISDWYYVRDGLMHGAWSVRAILDRLSKQDADRMRKLLAP